MRLQLVPSERQVEALAREGQAATTLRGLVGELAGRVAAGRERAGPEATRLIAEMVADKTELAELIDSGLGALRRLGVSASELESLPGARAQLFARALRGADQALLVAGLRDERGDVWLAADAVDASVLPGVRELAVAAWNRLGAGELRLLEALQRELRTRGGAVSLHFPGISGEESWRAVEAQQARLEARWADADDAPSMLRDEDKPASALELRITRAPNLASEARAVVRAVQERVAGGARLDRIAIVPLELSEPFLEELRSALWSVKLPFSEPRGRPPIAGPNVHATIELLRLIGGPIRRDALLDVLAAPGLRPQRWFPESGRRGLLSLRELLARVPVGFDRDGQLLLDRARALDEARRGEHAADACASLERLLNDLSRLGGAATRARLLAGFSSLLDELGLLRVDPRGLREALSARDQGRPGLLSALSDDSRGGGALAQAMSRLIAAAARLGLSEQPIRPQQLATELLRALEGVGQSRGAARAAAIAITRPAEVAGLPLDLVVVCRASTACFGGAGSSSTLALGAELCESLPRQRRPPTARDEQASTLVALNALLSSARYTELVYSTNEAGAETQASGFVDALVRAVPRARSLQEPGSPLAAGARRIVPLAATSTDAELRADVELARQASFFADRQPDALTGQVTELSAWVDPSLPPLSITRLERYMDCAFLGFSSIVLGATRDENVADALGARERGIMIHAAVAEALSAIAGHADESQDELLEKALTAAERSLSAHAGSALRGAALRMTLADVRSFVRWSLENREFSFREAERGFGEGEQWAPLALGPYRLSGRIDRIDVSSDGRRVRIIDYKSGQAPARSDAHALQGWLYARKVAAELSATEVHSLYLGLSRRVPQAKPIFSGVPDAPELLEREQLALEALERLRSGRVPAEPSRPSRCARCDARDLCRRPLSAPLPDDDREDA